MKKTVIGALAVCSMVLSAGCASEVHSPPQKNNSIQADNSGSATKGIDEQSVSAKEDSKAIEASGSTADPIDDTVVIDDISHWEHPTKEVFQKYEFSLQSVELTNNRKYPIFKVHSLGGHDLDNKDFLDELAAKNGFWDFQITDGQSFVNVYCDKANKQIYKTETNETIKDAATADLSSYAGVWYDASFADIENSYSKLVLEFVSPNQAEIQLESSTEETGKAFINQTILFDFGGEAKISGKDSAGNIIKAKISLYDGTIRFTSLSSQVNQDEPNIFTFGQGNFEPEQEYLNIQKAMRIITEKYGLVDNNKGFYIPKTDGDEVYFGYEGKTPEGKYTIAVRRCRDTVIDAWYNVDPDSEEVQIETW